jgi:hypothetical protein
MVLKRRCGTVALPEARARWTDALGQVLDHQGQFGERVGKLSGRRRSVGAEIVESPAELLNEGMACDDDPGGSITFQPSHRSNIRVPDGAGVSVGRRDVESPAMDELNLSASGSIAWAISTLRDQRMPPEEIATMLGRRDR